jgi:hypothetical protein
VADTFDALRKRSESAKTRLERLDWCSISVEMEGNSKQSSRNLAVVRIDGRVAGDVAGKEPRAFRVTPGEHTVVVRVRKQLWLHGCREQAIVALPLDLQPGEEVKLICGVRPEARKLASKVRAAELNLFLHFCFGSALAIAIGWAAYPVVNEFIERVSERLRVPSFWVPFALWLVGSRLATAAWSLVIWWVFMGRFSIERRRRLAASLRAEFVDPYFLKRIEQEATRAGLFADRSPDAS